MSIAISVQQFKKRYPRQKSWAVDDVSLEVEAGEIYGFIGPDGAGKSTLMKVIAGILTYDEGEVQVFQQPIHTEKDAEAIKAKLGFMPQGLGLNLYPDLSVEENIDFFAQLREVPADTLMQRKTQLLEMTQLTPFRQRAMKHLSGGMKQKLGLVCTLIHQPQLIILDEPTTGVDPVSRRDFWQILNTLVQEEGITALVSTAYMDEASRFHQLAVLNQGKILQSGTLDAILQTTPGIQLLCSASPNLSDLPPLPLESPPHIENLGNQWQITLFFTQPLTQAQQQSLLQWQQHQNQKRQILPLTLEQAFIHWITQNNHQNTPQKKLKNARIPSPAPSKSPTSMIQARQLTRKFNDFTAVDHLSFEVQEGEIFGLLGANGAGKSTAIKMLTGILPPTAGHGEVAGIDMRHGGIKIRHQIGYLSQAFSLYLDLTVQENLQLFGQIYGLKGPSLKQRIDWALEMGHLPPQALAKSLPMGKRQRLALGCALLHQPKVLFLDEPTSGVDPLGRLKFWDILQNILQTQSVAILITTHYMTEAEHCHRLGLMQAGRLIAHGTPLALKQQLQAEKGQVLSLLVKHPYDAQRILQQAGYECALFGNEVHLFSQSPEETFQHAQARLSSAQIPVLAHWVLPPSLEDVFIATLEKGAAHVDEDLS